MRRLMMLATVVFVMTALLVASAAPAFAGDGGATVTKYGDCGTGVDDPIVAEKCHLVSTPSGNENLQVHAHPQQSGPTTGGGATHEETACIVPQPGKAVITPSGNQNVHCTGHSPE
jgi:hypothetical protein